MSEAVTPGQATRAKRITLIHLLLLAGVSLALYAYTLSFSFVADDEEEVMGNQLIRSFANIPAMFSHNLWFFRAVKLGNYYRPLKLLTYSVEYHLFGLRPGLWHLVNLLCNLAVVLAVYFLVRDLLLPALASGSDSASSSAAGASARAGMSPAAAADAGQFAFWTALFFAFHPIHVEAVAWIAAGNDLECGLMLVLALWLYRRARLAAGARSLLLDGASLLLFFAALLLKETALIFPAVIIAYDFLYRRASFRELLRGWGRYAGYFVALGVYLVLRIHALGAFAPGRNSLHIAATDTLLSVPVLVAKYFWKAVVPVRLRYWYGFEPVRSLGWQPVAGTILLLAVILAILRLRRSQPLLSFALAWFLLLLTPVLHISRIGKNIFAERYLYIPSVGFCILAAWAWLWLRERAGALPVLAPPQPAAARGLEGAASSAPASALRAGGATARAARPVAYALLLALLAFYTTEIVRRLPVWHDNLRFWTKAAEQSPNAAVALAGAAYANFEVDRYQEGIGYAERAVKLDPDLAPAHSNLGMAYLSANRPNDALREVQKAVDLQPDDPALWSDLATVYRAEKQWQKAIEACYRGLALDMTSHDLLVNLGVALSQNGQRGQAIIAFRRAIAAEPDNLDAYIDLAGALTATGKPDEAIAELRQGVAANPGSPQAYLAHFELGLIYDSTARFQDAAREYQETLSLRPSFPAARAKLEALRPVLNLPRR